MGDWLERFNHYGFDRATYDECRELIVEANQSHAQVIVIWFVLINAFYYLSARFGVFNVEAGKQSFYLVFMLLALAVSVLATIGKKKSNVVGSVASLMILIMFESYSVMSSDAEPYATCWIFLILMVIIALSYIVTMGKMTIFLLVFSVIFCWMAYLHKPKSIAAMDLTNTVVVASLAIGLHFSFQRARVSEFVTTIRNIKMQHKLEISSDFDDLTNLLTRGKFFSMLEVVLAREHKENHTALLLIDLDGFKQINDQLGHQVGDLAIQLAGGAIMDTLHVDLSEQWDYPERVLNRGASFAGRLGGDEFIVLLQGYPDQAALLGETSAILEALHHIDEGGIHGLRASIGITMISDQDATTDAVYKRADDAVYTAKESGRDQICVN